MIIAMFLLTGFAFLVICTKIAYLEISSPSVTKLKLKAANHCCQINANIVKHQDWPSYCGSFPDSRQNQARMKPTGTDFQTIKGPSPHPKNLAKYGSHIGAHGWSSAARTQLTVPTLSHHRPKLVNSPQKEK